MKQFERLKKKYGGHPPFERFRDASGRYNIKSRSCEEFAEHCDESIKLSWGWVVFYFAGLFFSLSSENVFVVLAWIGIGVATCLIEENLDKNWCRRVVERNRKFRECMEDYWREQPIENIKRRLNIVDDMEED